MGFPRRGVLACLTALVTTVAFAAEAHADIHAKTKVRRFKDGRLVGEELLLESKAEGDLWGALYHAYELYESVKNLVASAASGNVVGAVSSAYGTYESAMELHDSLEDRTAAGDAVVSVDTNTPAYDAVEISFEPWSENGWTDDPLGYIRVGWPESLGSPESQGWMHLDNPSGNDPGFHPRPAVLRIDLRQANARGFSAGTSIPLVFRTKEKDCGQCLSIIHSLTVRVQASLSDTPACRSIANRIRNVEGQARDLANQIRAVSQDERSGWPESRRIQSRAADACLADWVKKNPIPTGGPAGPDGPRATWNGRMSAALRQCRRAASMRAGLCSEILRGITDEQSARRIRDLRRQIDECEHALLDARLELGYAGCYGTVVPRPPPPGWTLLGPKGLTEAGPAAVRTPDGVLRLFVVGRDGSLQHGWFDAAGRWNEFRTIARGPFVPIASPVAVAWGNTSVSVVLAKEPVGVGSAPLARVFWEGGAGWQEESLGTTLHGLRVAATATPDGNLQLWNVDRNGTLMGRTRQPRNRNQPLTDWSPRGGPTQPWNALVGVVGCVRGPGTVDLLGLGADGAWQHRMQGWHEWSLGVLPIQPASPRALCSRAPDELDLFALASGGNGRAEGIAHTLFRATPAPGAWRGGLDWVRAPKELGIVDVSAALSAVPLDANRVALFGRTADGRVWRWNWGPRRVPRPEVAGAGRRDDR